MPDLDSVIKECCKVCGSYRCKEHRDWKHCERHQSFWNPKLWMGCQMCSPDDDLYRSLPKENCVFCARKIEDGGVAYTDATPYGTFCESCARARKIAFWTITVKHGRLWTVAEIVAERKRGQPERRDA